MAAYISVPRDLTRVKSKILFNLTKRQLICFSVAAIVGVPVFFLLKRTGNVSLATLGMMLVMLPMFFLGMYEKDGQPLEKIAQHFIRAKIIRPQVRPYRTNNYYAALIRQDEGRKVSWLYTGSFPPSNKTWASVPRLCMLSATISESTTIL